MPEQITVHTYLNLTAETVTLIEDVPVELTICGENDGCGELHWWIDEIKAEFNGSDLVMSCSDARIIERRYPTIEQQAMRQLYSTAELDEGVAGDVADQLRPLVFERAA